MNTLIALLCLHMKTQVNAVSDPTPKSSWLLSTQVWVFGNMVKKIITNTWTASLNLPIFLHVSVFLLPNMSPMQSTGNTASCLPATEAPADCFGYLAKEGACEILRAGQEGWGVKEVCLVPQAGPSQKGQCSSWNSLEDCFDLNHHVFWHKPAPVFCLLVQAWSGNILVVLSWPSM